MLTAQVPVFCNGLHGVYLLGRQRIVCSCPDCMAKPEAKREHSCTQFEMHCGAGAAKKWKASLRVEPGGVPEVPKGAPLNACPTPLPLIPLRPRAYAKCRADVARRQRLGWLKHPELFLQSLQTQCSTSAA
jgi:hypothetical protein